jgi:ubiquinone/menaquinone biosynthesis C-methylase UbiE
MVGAEGKVVVLDISPEMLAVARGLPAPAGATIKWREGNAITLTVLDDAFSISRCVSKACSSFLAALRPCERCGRF